MPGVQAAQLTVDRKFAGVFDQALSISITPNVAHSSRTVLATARPALSPTALDAAIAERALWLLPLDDLGRRRVHGHGGLI
jgi:hypothetical protein